MNKKAVFGVYIILDTFFVGIGMGVPIFCILFGFPVGWYIAKRLNTNEADLGGLLGSILKYSFLTSIYTLILMLIIWGPISTMLLNPNADLANFGIPMILYDPKASFIGWIILMVFISPFLQMLTTIFASNATLWRLNKKEVKK
jgi:ABC-type spermidine/putrescine transport system permease subunit I